MLKDANGLAHSSLATRNVYRPVVAICPLNHNQNDKTLINLNQTATEAHREQILCNKVNKISFDLFIHLQTNG